MRIRLDSLYLDVTFQHKKYAHAYRLGHGNAYCIADTICTLTEVGVPDVVLGQGVGHCSDRDQFVKEKGRKVALTNALKSSGFNKNQRKCIWDAYLNRKPLKNILSCV